MCCVFYNVKEVLHTCCFIRVVDFITVVLTCVFYNMTVELNTCVVYFITVELNACVVYFIIQQ